MATRPTTAMSNECTVCGRVFSRPEHLTRHMTSHDALKAFACPICARPFARKDALQRHQLSHTPRHASPRPRSFRRACVACADAHTSCPGGQPCDNCTRRHVLCYRARRKRRQSHSRLQPTLPRAASMEGSADASDLLGVSAGPAASSSAPLPTAGTHAHAEDSCSTWKFGPVLKNHWDSASSEVAMNWLPYDVRADAASQPAISGRNGEDLSHPSSRDRDGAGPSDSMAMLIASMGPLISNQKPSAITIAPSTYPPLDEMGALYRDGDDTRSCQAERSIRQRNSSRGVATSPGTGVAFHRGQEVAWLRGLQGKLLTLCDRSQRCDRFCISDAVYNDILVKVNARIPLRSFGDSDFLCRQTFPSKDVLSYFIQMYFTYFHPVYPFLDQPLLSMPIWGWSVCLAAAAMGCRYANVPEAAPCSDAINLLLRDILIRELDFDHADVAMPYLQALILNILGLCQSNKIELMMLGHDSIGSVINACIRFGLFEELDPSGLEVDDQDLEKAWMAWRCREMRRRTGMFAWIVDCALSFMKRSSPFLTLQMLNLSVPCPEDLWAAKSWQIWHEGYKKTSDQAISPDIFLREEQERPAFQSTILKLYQNLTLIHTPSSLSGSVLIYALIQRTQEIAKYFDDPLGIMPGPDALLRPISNSTVKCYLPAIPSFTKWRNGACDYLDVLHWESLAHSSRERGLEGPIFLKLHLARLLLLAPVRELLALTDHLTKYDSADRWLPHHLQPCRMSLLACQETLQIWITKDKFKARLAVLHAGGAFWHIRRYATDTFVQPFTIFLATLVLCNFGQLACSTNVTPTVSEGELIHNVDILNTEQLLKTSSSRGGLSSQSPASLAASTKSPSVYSPCERIPRCLNIDRPVDDEFVQYFVRNGENSVKMSAEGVDDICSPRGARQILLEGAHLLRTSSHYIWPVSNGYATRLEMLATQF